MRRRAGFERVQIFARLEANGFSRGDADLGACPGIAADAGFACTDAEDAESAQFDALARCQGLFQALEDRIHRGFGLAARQARALDYMMDDVLLNQWGTLAGITLTNVLRLTMRCYKFARRIENGERKHLSSRPLQIICAQNAPAFCRLRFVNCTGLSYDEFSHCAKRREREPRWRARSRS
jgi:hypothetical protein